MSTATKTGAQGAAGTTGPSRRTAMIAGVAAVLLIVGGGAAIMVWSYLHDQRITTISTMSETTDQVIAGLAAATTTAEVRSAAAVSQEALAEQDLDSRQADAYRAFWEQVAPLTALERDTLSIWQAAKPGLQQSAAGLPGEQAAAAADAIASVDMMVVAGQEALARWQAEQEAAAAADARNIAIAAQVAVYLSTVDAQMQVYESQRDLTAAQVQPLYDPEISDSAIWAVLTDLQEGIAVRQASLAVLNAQSVPEGLAPHHARLTMALQSSIVAMNDAVSGINEALEVKWSAWPEPGVFDIAAAPSWQLFQAESLRLNTEFDAAWASLHDAATELIELYRTPAFVSPKPEV